MRVLVTGAAGFLGAALVRTLNAAGYEIIAGCRRPEAAWRLMDLPAIVPHLLDLTDPIALTNLLLKYRPEAVIHTAAYGVSYGQNDVPTAYQVNIAGTEQLLRGAAAAGVERFIHIGSCFEYGHAKQPLQETDPLRPTGVYGLSKAAATRLAVSLAKTYSLKLLVVRPFSLWGRDEEQLRLVPSILRACLRGEEIELTAGEQVRDYLYLDDAAIAIVKLLKAEYPCGEIVNLGSGQPVYLREFAKRIASVLGGDRWLRFGLRPYRSDEMMTLLPDLSRLRELLPSGFGDGDFDARVRTLAHDQKAWRIK